jgi:hypothetical protein
MTLLNLPTELLFYILSYLGLKFLRQDIRRLCVSRKWFEIAWQFLLQDISLTGDSLIEFGRDINYLSRTVSHIITVDIRLQGFVDWEMLRREDLFMTPDGAPPEVIEAWTGRLDVAMRNLAATLPRCSRLKSLRIKAGPESDEISISREGYLMANPLASILSLNQLTSLDIDTAGSNPNRMGGIHLCCSINSILPSLERLRCRMDSICEKLLEPPAPGIQVNLKEVLINMSISQLCSGYYGWYYPEPCRPTCIREAIMAREKMIKKAVQFARRLKNPRMVRLVMHGVPSLRMFTYDAVKVRRMELDIRDPWDADGEEVTHSDWESEKQMLKITKFIDEPEDDEASVVSLET